MAALGREVVPEVNWMLIVSSARSGSSGTIGLRVEEFGSKARS